MHIVLWQFTVASEHREAFLRAYGPDGDWARLFRRAAGYLGTELLSSTEDPTRFLTIDRWQTLEHLANFRASSGDEYSRLDEQLEHLTASETKIGDFTLTSPPER